MSSNYRKPIDRERALLDLAVPCDYTSLCTFIEIMAERYDFLSVTGIGESILSRKIYMLTLGNEKAEKSVLYVGCHHGAEWITSLVLLRLVNELCEYYKASKQPFGINMQTLFSQRCLRIVPCLNPDGADLVINGVSKENILYERLMKMSGGDFSKWQANARGVDLNHNYDGGFLEYKRLEKENKIYPGATRYSGECPLSEPETASLASFIKYDSTVRMILTLHSAGEEIYYSSGGVYPPGARSIAEKLSRLSGYKLSEPSGLASYGGLTDWYIKEFGRPAFTVECGKGENPIGESKYFSIYAAIREMLMTAPLLI
ncbi:MAG: peptidase M14 [Ruminococcaceae bacterium]|nr:peptidase M14 [Oscillospiraceae bacterium]